MKVKCIKLLDESGAPIKESQWITVDRTYHVLEVFFSKDDGRLDFRLIGDSGHTPAYHDANQFELVSNHIPSSWVADFVPDKYFALLPGSWARHGFWEDYFDGVEEARTQFDEEREKMLGEDL